jgi:endonuclease/exonuclease/phosphatase (EEP) superfamily protein YafD
MLLVDLLVGAAALALAAATLLPLIETTRWWVRAMEFPRIQIAVCAALLLVGALVWRGGIGWSAAVIATAVLVWQTWKIMPYTPFHAKELRSVPVDSAGDDVRFLAANVLMENDDHQAVRDLIAATDADVVLLMETDKRWTDALAQTLSGYPTVLTRPLDNHYGMVFATRLKVFDATLVELTTAETPSVLAELESPAGQRFRFLGLHPVPPVPGEDVETQNAQMLYAARFAKDSDVPIVAMGDFNTVAWSKLAQRFKTAGGYLDPRIGRGPVPSFDATSWLLRFPLDQIYVAGGVALVDFHRGGRIGSDHFPMVADLRFDAALARRLNREAKPLEPDAESAIAALIESHRDRLEAHRRSERRGPVPGDDETS